MAKKVKVNNKLNKNTNILLNQEIKITNSFLLIKVIIKVYIALSKVQNYEL